MILKKCVNGTEQDCSKWGEDDLMSILEKEEALEEVVWNGLKMWHLIFLSIAGVSCVIILFCCCVKFRIPRTKQEIEADYIRRQILRKFRKRLKAIQNQELDEMDLKKALDKIRAEFKSDTESLAQSEAGFSAATISSNVPPRHGSSTYRRASQIQIDISLEDLRAQSLGPKARLMLALSRLCGRSKTANSDKVALTVDAEGEAHLTVPDGAFKSKGHRGEEDKQKKTKPESGGKKEKETKSEPSAGKSSGKKSDPVTKQGKEKENADKKAQESSKDKKKKDKDEEKKKDNVKNEKKKEGKTKDVSVKPKDTLEVKGQSHPEAGTSSGGGSQPQKPQSKEDTKKQDDKKQKEKEEKERKKAEKEKERIEKEKAKAEKTKLKIENEKVQKAQKEKAKEEKKKEKIGKDSKTGEKAK